MKDSCANAMTTLTAVASSSPNNQCEISCDANSKERSPKQALHNTSGFSQSEMDSDDLAVSEPFRQRIKFSVIVPCLNEQEVIARCLGALNELELDKETFEVIICDNGSTDDTLATARAATGLLNVKYVSQDEGRVTAVRNLGAKAARGEFLAFLDADCLVPKSWLSLAGRQLSSPGAGLVGGHCGLPENSPWVPRVWYSERQWYKQGAVSYLPGANLLISRANFFKLNGFDESLETNEDCELCERARRNGLTVVAFPDLGVIHLRDPQTLSAFYGKQAWHGKHVLKVFLSSLPSMVNVRPLLFAFYTLFSVLGVAASLVTGRFMWFGVWVGLSLLPSIVLSLRIALRRGLWLNFPPLVVLHLAYGLARASALLDPRNWTGQSKTSERVNTGQVSSSSSERAKQTSDAPR